jgi:spore maturation protein SpmA
MALPDLSTSYYPPGHPIMHIIYKGLSTKCRGIEDSAEPLRINYKNYVYNRNNEKDYDEACFEFLLINTLFIPARY